MKKLLAITLFLFTLLHFTPSTAQSKTVTINGKVTSFEESLPLEGVSIQVKNSKNATGTQPDGTFTLSVSAEEKLLVISLPGYEKKEIPVTSAKEYDIVLKRANNFSWTNMQTQLIAGRQNEMLK